ncbi:hypothetical protein C8Q74DRAFT_571893 [Fomes fomentarius]|nr:hypothetical protein C8Q74DRAFT_571893 [Fomes fomentarius]
MRFRPVPDTLLAKRYALQRDLAAINAQINAFTYVNQLPDELLVAIFSYVRLFPEQPGEVHWTALLGVCHCWYEVIRTSPTFWRDIRVFRSIHWMTLSLSRCAGAVVDLTFLAASFPHAALQTSLASHTSHIRSLAFEDVGQSWIKSLSSLFQCHMPVLERLVMINPMASGIWTGLGLSATQLPRLQWLKLCRLAVPSGVSHISNLRILDLSSTPLPMSLKQFLTEIKKFTGLRELLLAHTLNDIPGGVLRLPAITRGTPVDVPQLRKIHIHGGACQVLWHILNSIHIPAASDIEISGDIRGMERDIVPDGHLFMTSLFRVPYSPLTIFPILGAVTSIDLDLTCHYRLIASTPTHRVCLVLHEEPETSFLFTVLPHSLRDVISIFQTAPVTSVSVRAPYEEHAPTGAWRELFAAFPLLETLSLGCWGEYEPVWDALRDAPPEHASTERLWCPILKAIIVEDAIIYPDIAEFFDPILGVLRFRAEMGNKLHRLSLSVRHDDPEDEEMAQKVYVPLLEEVVTNVTVKFLIDVDSV